MSIFTYSKIIGCGGYLPERIVTNSDLEKSLDTNDEWIRSRTGITQRHIAGADEFASNLAYEASKIALVNAGIKAEDLDLIIVCTTTPDNSLPSTASKLQSYLGLSGIAAFDLQAVCSGFLYGIEVANSMIASGRYNTVLVVCAEKMSSILDWSDRSTCILFGDGAGAVILAKSETSNFVDCRIFSDGSLWDILYTDGGVSSTGKSGVIKMNGREVFKNAVNKMTDSINLLLKENNIDKNDIDFFIPHQANIRIIDSVAQNMSFDSTKIVKTIANHANCSAASIPLALFELYNLGKLKSGDLILFSAVGAGLTWGSALVRW